MTLASLWTLDSGVTLTSDGDLGTLAGTTASNGASQTVAGSLSTTTYPKLFCRAKSADSTVRTLDILVTYTSGTDTFTMTALGTSWQNFTFTLTTAKTISSVKFQNQSVSGSLLLDFVYPFKETLTLPTAIRPLQEQDVSIMPVIPILGRQGGVTQYLGSMSPRYIITGGLVSTTSGQSGWTNTYTADQWWQLLKGVWIEQNTIQADGNPTWQWLTSDNLNGKIFLTYGPQQVPGRLAYHDYILTLVEFDINGLTTGNLPGITY